MTTLDKIFEKMNKMSNNEFQSWMLNNHDDLKQEEKDNIINAIAYGNTFPEYQSDIDDIGEGYYKWTYLKNEEDKQNLKNLNLKK